MITERLEQGAEIAASPLCSYTDRERQRETEWKKETTCDGEIAKRDRGGNSEETVMLPEN